MHGMDFDVWLHRDDDGLVWSIPDAGLQGRAESVGDAARQATDALQSWLDGEPQADCE